MNYENQINIISLLRPFVHSHLCNICAILLFIVYCLYFLIKMNCIFNLVLYIYNLSMMKKYGRLIIQSSINKKHGSKSYFIYFYYYYSSFYIKHFFYKLTLCSGSTIFIYTYHHFDTCNTRIRK